MPSGDFFLLMPLVCLRTLFHLSSMIQLCKNVVQHILTLRYRFFFKLISVGSLVLAEADSARSLGSVRMS